MPAALMDRNRDPIYIRLTEASEVAKKKKQSVSQSKDFETAPTSRPENIIISEMLVAQGRHWEISDGTKAEPGRWYKSKRGYLVLAWELLEDGSIKAQSHTTGNMVRVPPDQVLHFTRDEDPGIPCGTIIQNSESEDNNNQNNTEYNSLYSKYPHVIPGSIYKVQNVGVKDNSPMWERKRKGKKTEIKGQVRCKITCQEPGCTNERDIKVQDAFQVKKCEACRDSKKKKNLKEFLSKKKKEPK